MCVGDPAFMDGYIISPEGLRDLIDKGKLLETVKGEREEYRVLSDSLKKQREAYKTQRDSLRELIDWSNALRTEYKSQRDETLGELSEWEDKFYILRDRVYELEENERSSWTTWEVGFLSGGIAVAGVLAGVGVGYLISL